MKYYTAKDIMQSTGLGKTSSYKLISDLNIKFKREYPGTITLCGKIPIWYFEKKMKMEGVEENEKN